MNSNGEKQLREAIQRWRNARRNVGKIDGVSQAPGCVFGMITREVLDNLAGDVDDLRAEMNWMRRVVVAAVVTAAIATLLRLLGWN